MPPLPADSIHARACKLKCEKILTRPAALRSGGAFEMISMGVADMGTKRNADEQVVHVFDQ